MHKTLPAAATLMPTKYLEEVSLWLPWELNDSQSKIGLSPGVVTCASFVLPLYSLCRLNTAPLTDIHHHVV